MDIVLQKQKELGIIPVISISKEKHALPLVEALLEDGIPCVEITFRIEAAEGAIANIAKYYPEVLIGAGTVLSIDQAKKAVSSGANFLVSPGFDDEIVAWSIQMGVPIKPF